MAKNKNANDYDISEYSEVASLIINDIFSGTKMEETVEDDLITLYLVEIFTIFNKLSPDGSRAEDLASAITSSFHGLKITSINKKLLLMSTVKVINERALYPDLEIEKLELVDLY